MSDFKPGERILLEQAIQVTFVKDLPDGTDAIIQLGNDTHVVSLLSLSR